MNTAQNVISKCEAIVGQPIAKGEGTIGLESSKTLVNHGVLSEEEFVQAIVDSAVEHYDLIDEVLERRPDLAELLLFNRNEPVSSDYIEAVMNGDPIIWF